MRQLERSTRTDFPSVALSPEAAQRGPVSGVNIADPASSCAGTRKAMNQMAGNKKRILCIGLDPVLLHSRCLVLENAGYLSTWAIPNEAEIRLRTESYDLVIVSVPRLAASQLGPLAEPLIPAVALVIENFSGPAELLEEIAGAFARASRQVQ